VCSAAQSLSGIRTGGREGSHLKESFVAHRYHPPEGCLRSGSQCAGGPQPPQTARAARPGADAPTGVRPARRPRLRAPGWAPPADGEPRGIGAGPWGRERDKKRIQEELFSAREAVAPEDRCRTLAVTGSTRDLCNPTSGNIDRVAGASDSISTFQSTRAARFETLVRPQQQRVENP